MVGGTDYTCPECGAQGIDSWPYDHCWKCGFREKESAETSGVSYGGGTPDDPEAVSVDPERTY